MDRGTKRRQILKSNILSWVLALDGNVHVSCPIKGCKFMCFSVIEIANHFVYCPRNSEIPFTCKMCKLNVGCKENLIYHKIYSHTYKPSENELLLLEMFQKKQNKEITPILKKSWLLFYELRKYYKCFRRPCLYITDTLEEMESHYLYHCNKKLWRDLIFQCNKCNGHFYNKAKYEKHVLLHSASKVKTKRTCEIDVRKKWIDDIFIHKQAKCPINVCRFYSNVISILEKHYEYCTGDKGDLFSCPHCNCWLLNNSKLEEHVNYFHESIVDETEQNTTQNHLEVEVAVESLESLPNQSSGPSPTESSESSSNQTSNCSEEEDLSVRVSSNDKKYNRGNLIKRWFSSLSVESSRIEQKSKPINYSLMNNSREIVQFPDDIAQNLSSEIPNITYSNFNDHPRSMILPDVNYADEEVKVIKQSKKRKNENQTKKKSVGKKTTHEYTSTLSIASKEIMNSSNNTSTVSLQIELGGTNFVVEAPAPPIEVPFPKTIDDVVEASKREAFKLLELIAPKTTIRNDHKRYFVHPRPRLCPFAVSLEKGVELSADSAGGNECSVTPMPGE